MSFNYRFSEFQVVKLHIFTPPSPPHPIPPEIEIIQLAFTTNICCTILHCNESSPSHCWTFLSFYDPTLAFLWRAPIVGPLPRNVPMVYIHDWKLIDTIGNYKWNTHGGKTQEFTQMFGVYPQIALSKNFPETHLICTWQNRKTNNTH